MQCILCGCQQQNTVHGELAAKLSYALNLSSRRDCAADRTCKFHHETCILTAM